MPVGKDGIVVSTTQVSTLKRKEREIQQESGFKINVLPVNTARAINEMVSKKDIKSYENMRNKPDYKEYARECYNADPEKLA